jgi:hypothetical protein
MEKSLLYMEKPQRLFAEFFSRHNIPYLDLLPTLRAVEPPPTLHKTDIGLPQDINWPVKQLLTIYARLSIQK